MPNLTKTHITLLSLVLAVSSGCSIPKVESDSQLETETKIESKTRHDTRYEALHESQAATISAAPLKKQINMSHSLKMKGHEMKGHEVSTRHSKDTERYQALTANNIKKVSENSVSTFSIDVDTAAYSNTRRVLNQGRLPSADMVRTEELVNYFRYDYETPSNKDRPFSVTSEIAPTPWNTKSYLLNIGIKGFDVGHSDLPAANLVFLIDVSGSMSSSYKLGLVKKSFQMLTRQLDEKDRVSIVVYAGAAGMVLAPTPGNDRVAINSALDNLTSGGSTNGSAGIELAYQLAQQSFIKGGINRVIIASDGDMNVGISNTQALLDLIKQKRDFGISLTTLGYGMGNYNSHLMEQLADVGNGNAAYIDNLREAQKVLVEEMSSTLFTIAKDVKIQIEFSPLVSEYRLIGYENRLLNREDFNNDKVDAGDIGAGHTVTALYEITLASDNHDQIDPLRYTQTNKRSVPELNELAFLKLRYKLPSTSMSISISNSTSKLVSYPINKSIIQNKLSESSNNFKFSAAVAAFGQRLRGGNYLVDDFDYEEILSLAREGKGADNNGYRGEFVQLVKLANSL
jgi:Ca-activated chloride channel homolog